MSSRSRSSLFCASIAASIALASSSAFAGDKTLAEALYQEGLKLMDGGKFDQACPKLEESQRQDPGTGTQIALAKCYDKAGKTASAWGQYKEVAFLFKKAGNAAGEKAAMDKAGELEKKLSKLQINAAADTPGLVIRRDNEEVGKAVLGTALPVDPGPHVIEATAPGYQVWQTTVTVGKENDSQTVTIPSLTAAPKKANSLRTVSYVVGGVGVAGLIAGGVFGGLAASSKGKLSTECPKNVCPPGKPTDDLNSAKTSALISTIGLGVGGAALATGVVLFIVSGSSKKEEAAPAAPTARFVPTFGPQGGALSLVGSF